MMDDMNPFDRPAGTPQGSPEATPAAETPTAQPSDVPAGTPAPETGHSAESSAAVMKFKSCRWRSDPEAGEFCTHRDVLPFAGKTSFNPDSWCPECAFYKLRRTPKKRERVDYSY
jgi:hypothetical protein